MAHDFAKQRSAASNGRRTQGAARRKPPSAGTHWSWFFTGLLCGLFVAFVGYLGFVKPTPAEEIAASEEPAPDNPLARAAFDFYQYLPQAEVAVDVEPVEVKSGQADTPAPAAQTTAQTAAQPAATTGAQAAPTQVAVVQSAPDDGGDVQYLLQAGSFQAREEAEALRASIILMNLQANVVPGTVAGKTWHRVQVGPFAGRSAAEVARDSLTGSGIETIVLRMR